MNVTPKKPKGEYENGEFFLVPCEIYEWGLSPLAAYLYLALASYTDIHGKCYPSRKTLGDKIGRSVVTVDKGLKELEENGLIDIIHCYNEKGQSSNLYTLFHLTNKNNALNNLVRTTSAPDGSPLAAPEYY